MMALQACPISVIDAMGIVSIVLSLLGIACIIEAASVGRQRLMVAALALTVFLGVLSSTLGTASAVITEQYDRPIGCLVSAVLSQPVAVPIVLIALAGAIETVLWRRLRAMHSVSITFDSIKEALDNLPDAVLFCTANGEPLLRNVQSEMLGLSSDAAAGSLRDEAGRFWQIMRAELDLKGSTVTEIVAQDASEEYALVRELEERNARLDEINGRLRAFDADMVHITREEEVLAAKVRVHDEMGRVLVALRAYELQDISERDREALLGTWRRAMMLMRTATVDDKEPRDAWEQLVEATHAIDVDLVLDGALPDNPQQRAAAVALVHECLNNAVRHGGARSVTVRATDSGDAIVLEVENDGAPPKEAAAEGGGLANVRAVVEKAGGTMSVAWKPRVCVTARFDTGSVVHA